MDDWDEQLEAVDGAGLIAAPWVADAVRWLDEGRSGPVRRVLDIGAGTGHAAVQLARAFPEAVVTAVEPTRAILTAARQRFAESGLDGRVRPVVHDVGHPDEIGRARSPPSRRSPAWWPTPGGSPSWRAGFPSECCQPATGWAGPASCPAWTRR
jgi:SAM-dependent methyltransferase